MEQVVGRVVFGTGRNKKDKMRLLQGRPLKRTTPPRFKCAICERSEPPLGFGTIGMTKETVYLICNDPACRYYYDNYWCEYGQVFEPEEKQR